MVYKFFMKEDSVCMYTHGYVELESPSLNFFHSFSVSCLQVYLGALVQNQLILSLHINHIMGMGEVGMSNPVPQASGELGHRFLASIYCGEHLLTPGVMWRACL